MTLRRERIEDATKEEKDIVEGVDGGTGDWRGGGRSKPGLVPGCRDRWDRVHVNRGGGERGRGGETRGVVARCRFFDIGGLLWRLSGVGYVGFHELVPRGDPAAFARELLTRVGDGSELLGLNLIGSILITSSTIELSMPRGEASGSKGGGKAPAKASARGGKGKGKAEVLVISDDEVVETPRAGGSGSRGGQAATAAVERNVGGAQGAGGGTAGGVTEEPEMPTTNAFVELKPHHYQDMHLEAESKLAFLGCGWMNMQAETTEHGPIQMRIWNERVLEPPAVSKLVTSFREKGVESWKFPMDVALRPEWIENPDELVENTTEFDKIKKI
ncbi:hypothetical protein DENSPDRAFT_855702, partial [Dentipellis sp. KUC8613]